MSKKIIGIDCSTTTIGITVLDEIGKLLCMTFVKPTGKSFIEKAISAEIQLKEKLFSQFSFSKNDTVIIEQPSQMFKTGFSSAKVISTINRFNGIIHYIIYSNLKIIPIEIATISARKKVIGIGRFPTGINAKEKVWEWVDKRMECHDWPLKKTGKLKDECFDMTDSYIVAYSQIIV